MQQGGTIPTQRNASLEALLTKFGYTHQALADMVNRIAADEFGEPANCTDRHVRRWISGHVRWSWPRHFRPLECIFGRSPQEMGFMPRAASLAPARARPAAVSTTTDTAVFDVAADYLLAAQAEHAGRPAEAARINKAALGERHLRNQPLITSLLHARLADCLAQINDPRGMGRQLVAAERAYDRAGMTTAPSWLVFLTPAELSGLGAIAHQSAGDFARAEQHVLRTLDLLEDGFNRNRTLYAVLLAELQLAQGEHERAAATAATVRSGHIASSRISARLTRVAALGQGGRT